MAEAEKSTGAGPISGADELKFRHYEAKLGFWKVVVGTMIVGLAGVSIPGAVSFYTAHFENARKEAELKLSEQSAHQQYIKDFFTTAINQDIELRIRFAHYFANLAEPVQKNSANPGAPHKENPWKKYLEDLKQQRDDNRRKINELEGQLMTFKNLSRDNIEFARIERERKWAYAEIGYQPLESSTVLLATEESPVKKKERLYIETTSLVQKLAALDKPLDENPSDLARFWDLYRKDLIGVESPSFASAMIAIGTVIKKLVIAHSPPDLEMKELSVKLHAISQRELAEESRAAAQ